MAFAKSEPVSSFDGQGNCLPVAPSSTHVIDLLRELQAAMEEADPAREKWVVCSMRISHDDKVDVDFEYRDANRWKFGMDEYMERMQEIVATPIHGAGTQPETH